MQGEENNYKGKCEGEGDVGVWWYCLHPDAGETLYAMLAIF